MANYTFRRKKKNRDKIETTPIDDVGANTYSTMNYQKYTFYILLFIFLFIVIVLCYGYMKGIPIRIKG